MKNTKAVFVALFDCSLDQWWHPQQGFLFYEFLKMVLKVPEGFSWEDFVRNEKGEEAVYLIKGLRSGLQNSSTFLRSEGQSRNCKCFLRSNSEPTDSTVEKDPLWKETTL